jgi:hypothetical protein
MEKVYFQNYTSQQINLYIDNREISLAPQSEEWTILPLGPANIILASYIVGFKKKRETFQIHIKEGTNYVDILMDEVVQKNTTFQNNHFTFIFFLVSISQFISIGLNAPLPLFDLFFFIFNTSHLTIIGLILLLFESVRQTYNRRKRINQLSTVFVLDVH